MPFCSDFRFGTGSNGKASHTLLETAVHCLLIPRGVLPFGFVGNSLEVCSAAHGFCSTVQHPSHLPKCKRPLRWLSVKRRVLRCQVPASTLSDLLAKVSSAAVTLGAPENNGLVRFSIRAAANPGDQVSAHSPRSRGIPFSPDAVVPSRDPALGAIPPFKSDGAISAGTWEAGSRGLP